MTPVYVFPIVVNLGDVLKRGGHTEAGVDIVELAGVAHAAVICELVNLDGTIVRLPEIMECASVKGIKVTTKMHKPHRFFEPQ
ncbi:3,4-dihydroxy-2-butanone-4-phosphate synthase [Anaplasma phagocytophilum]|uniref:3,4-dihydroxy-2-butanone-4-phosphate synthase n=1 Tax=Anaplasma phagocytophilum TaxID=948 RepID=UPI0007E24462|nr:3,4-dihydroxy-2-butanone-4-phosphate synthase [Anaplasma phagocytophilum]SBO30292.1 3,4-dihydroxy-2-butanone 4-phosphate synthase [Anaplasma phagocytophilum]SBO30325.1 3,4-dihydroxy-2-butanone 4-phosphate synthase [Anaplasma phagocytophilum]SBO30745.1 3,4-dihydroxy-2-butanone 4-phosphate synthase [Anaplasma phagocytophilum]SCV61930.1 3,4-dihydroxy-2-butanone 4-phosphate synthase [Anaplasma phagocytophilum]